MNYIPIYIWYAGIQFSIQPTFTTVPESSGQVSVTIVRDDESTENSPPVNFTVTTMSGTAISKSFAGK